MSHAESHRPQIALALDTSTITLHRAAQGVLDYAREHTHWDLLTNPDATRIRIKAFQDWDGDGIIAMINSDEDLAYADQIKAPIVSLALWKKKAEIHYIYNDHYAIGQMAGRHLQSCGFERFAYFGFKDLLFSEERRRGFADAVAPRPVAELIIKNEKQSIAPWSEPNRELDQWLKRLEPPVGLFVVHDSRARATLDRCKELGIRVPEDIAVVGVDDDEIQCLYSAPPLSSVRPDWYRSGYEAARALDGVLQGRYAGPSEARVPPERMVQRDSSAVGIYGDPFVTQAQRYIQTHIHEAIGVDQLADALNVSRRWLQKTIKAATDQTPYEFICSIKVKQAKHLLDDPSQNVKTIAATCGFNDMRQFRLTFTKSTGLTPLEYRERQPRLQENSGD